MMTVQHLWLALSFYTRLPCPKNLDYLQLPQATLCLPVVGWLVGSLVGLSFYVGQLLWSQTVAVIIALIVGILLTGAFHEDGFADVCDGFGGGYGKQRMLDIMKDPHIGTYGVLGLLLLLFLKISLLSTLPITTVPWLLLAGHSISRFAPLYLMYQYDYTRLQDSKTGSAMYKPNRTECLLALYTAILPLVLLPLWCVFTLLPLWLTTFMLGRYFYHHIGGYTGDCLGASQQVTEAIFYLSVSALWTFI
jgi:adenosylcobinamide-GDP ribazoletransferase